MCSPWKCCGAEPVRVANKQKKFEEEELDKGSTRKIVVIKLGGSVLVDDSSYQEAARFLVRRLQTRNEERLVVVVSAIKVITD